jgi:hypothetical protein
VPQYVTRQITQGMGDTYEREVATVASWLATGSRSYAVDVKMARFIAQVSMESASA